MPGDPSDFVDTDDYDAGFFSMKPTKEALVQLHEWLVQNKLVPVVSHVFPFTEAGVQEAHQKSEWVMSGASWS
ncbi:MAG: zinc-binding dehydrogenase [Alkalibacterium sp.]|nr:zinc-binding dehydrogenase [Alkalibacterium sp.]